jgi:hypothetical protein
MLFEYHAKKDVKCDFGQFDFDSARESFSSGRELVLVPNVSLHYQGHDSPCSYSNIAVNRSLALVSASDVYVPFNCDINGTIWPSHAAFANSKLSKLCMPSDDGRVCEVMLTALLRI